MKAVVYHEPGGPEVLQYTEVPDPEPGPVDVVVDVAAAALNRLDVVQRDQVVVDDYRMTTVDESALYAKAQQMGEAITVRSGLPDKAKFPMR